MDAEVTGAHRVFVHPRTGRATVLSPEGEPMHSSLGPMEEALALHVEGSGLRRRAPGAPAPIVWDVGLGAGANAVAALECGPVELWSFEDDLRGLGLALSDPERFAYLAPWRAATAALLAAGRWQSADRSWRLLQGDFRERLPEAPVPDVVFYDFYDPPSCPALWGTEAFARLARRLPVDRPALLTTYSSSTRVRAAMALAGLFIGEGPSTDEKKSTTIASNRSGALPRPLDAGWLGRVERSSDPFPFDWPTDARDEAGRRELLARLERALTRVSADTFTGAA